MVDKAFSSPSPRGDRENTCLRGLPFHIAKQSNAERSRHLNDYARKEHDELAPWGSWHCMVYLHISAMRHYKLRCREPKDHAPKAKNEPIGIDYKGFSKSRDGRQGRCRCPVSICVRILSGDSKDSGTLCDGDEPN